MMFASLLAIAVSGCSTPQIPVTPVSGAPLALVFTARGEGEIEPCG